MKKIRFILPILCMGLIFTSCKDDDKPLKDVQLNVTIEKPIDFPEGVLSEPKAVLTETNTGNVYAVKPEQFTDNAFSIKVKEGNYTLQATAKMSYKTAQGILSEALLELATDMRLAGDKDTVQNNVAFIYKGSASGFVLEEIFFTSTLTPEGKQYYGTPDQYVKITNNSDETLYADGLALLESDFTTVQKWDYTPDIMNEAFAAHAIYVVPGNGTRHPVKPGESLIIADNAMNHTTVNANSIDLSKADFEWYDVSSNPKIQDIDNPEVPNLDKYYCYTRTIWGIHSGGNRSIAIAKMPVSKDEYLRTQKYDYTYIFKFNDYVKEMSGSAYKVPNVWILDAVNLSQKKEFAWILTSPELDAGWTYCSETYSDKTRYGLAVRRKVTREANGRKYLKDTNNSTDDFEPRVKPSLMK